MSVFKAVNTGEQPRPKAPTSYEFFKDATTGQKKLRPSVEVVFPPSGDISSWGFVSSNMRFNVYRDDPRYDECLTLINLAVQNNHLLRIVYAPTERGLATLEVCKKKKGEWKKVSTRWLITQI